MNFFYRIMFFLQKDPKDTFSFWDKEIIDIGYIEAIDRKEARKKLEKIYDTNFSLRMQKKDRFIKDFKMLQLFNPSNYYDDFWLGKRKCKNCNKEFTRLERDRATDFEYIKNDFCSKECEEEFTEKKIIEYNNDNNAIRRNDGYIYLIENKVNNMFYVGQTTQVFTLRWYQHFYQSNNLNDKFHKAIKETNIKEWNFSILEVIKNKNGIKEMKEILNERENFYIKKFNSVEKGYNSTVVIPDKNIKNNSLELF